MTEKIFDYSLFLFLAINLYLFFNLVLPPKIKLIYPTNEIVNSNPIIIKGYTDKRGELFINAVPVYLQNDGYFEKEFYLKEGVNNFTFKAIKHWGQTSLVEKKIILTTNEKNKQAK
ncbi:MAG: hypothetical protein KatS3mg097_326 [Candidatus Parcubacteria bacterium]|nr:MAG: hypothetical protein KatS3mg097_326 [Candidatus Parcubacteria bacterium]